MKNGLFARFMAKLGYQKVGEAPTEIETQKEETQKQALAALQDLTAQLSRGRGGIIQQNSEDGLQDVYMFDFLNLKGGNACLNANGGIDSGAAGSISVGGWNSLSNFPTPQVPDAPLDGDNGEVAPNGIVFVKPKDVLHELETIPTPWSVELLDQKIEMMKDKERLIIQQYAKREVSALIECLENRKKYADHREFFERFQNTNDEKIDALLAMHGLVMKTSDIFIPEFPQDAIDVMKAYNKKVREICNKLPIYYVIATKDMFRDANGKRDPILLVQSPFGFYWQILGAWDEEMLILSEL